MEPPLQQIRPARIIAHDRRGPAAPEAPSSVSDRAVFLMVGSSDAKSSSCDRTSWAAWAVLHIRRLAVWFNTARVALHFHLHLGPLGFQRQPQQLAEGNATRNQQPLDGLAHVRVGTWARKRHANNSPGPQPDLRP